MVRSNSTFRPISGLASESSAAYRAGNPEFVDENTRTDLLGNPRPEGVNPDVGAYQYMTPTE